MNVSDYEQDLEELVDTCSLDKSILQPSAKGALSPAEVDNRGEMSKLSAAAAVAAGGDRTGKARRKKRRLRNEPESIIGESTIFPLSSSAQGSFHKILYYCYMLLNT